MGWEHGLCSHPITVIVGLSRFNPDTLQALLLQQGLVRDEREVYR